MSTKSDKAIAIYDHVIVLQPDPASKTSGGIHLPDTGRIPFYYGKVLSVGAKVSSSIEPGDIVFYDASASRTLALQKGTATQLIALPEAGIYLCTTQSWARAAGFPIPEGTLKEHLTVKRLAIVG